jgi:hypothetical protein
MVRISSTRNVVREDWEEIPPGNYKGIGVLYYTPFA